MKTDTRLFHQWPRRRRAARRATRALWLLLAALAAPSLVADNGAPSTWDGFRNQLLPQPPRTTRQDFGWRATRNAGGKAAGEIGGWVGRSLTPARYVMKLPRVLGFHEPLEVSGRLAVTKCEGGSGVLVGWRNGKSTGWRTPNSLSIRVDGNGGKYWLFYEYGGRRGSTGGGGAFEGDRYQTTPTAPFLADGSSRAWRLRYEPGAAKGPGQLTFRIDDRAYVVEVPLEHKCEGLELDEFGIWNQETSGDGLELWLDDLIVGGEAVGFDRDPNWIGVGNKTSFPDTLIRPFHQFGLLPPKGQGVLPGIGGVIWRDERPAYFGDAIAPLTLDQPLHASGTIRFTRAGADSGVYLGWFNANAKRTKETPEHVDRQRSYLGILLEGPSRVGHYFRPGYATDSGLGGNAESGPILRPDGVERKWSIRYDPSAKSGHGVIGVSLDGVEQSYPLRDGDRRAGATFDRFGLFNLQSGGWHVEVEVRDLRFSGQRPRP